MKTMRFIGIVLALFSAGSPPAAQAQDSGKKYKVYMVSNSHLDTQWRWDVKATIDDYLYNTAVQNLALLEKYPIPDIEVLVVGHHGSKYSSCREFLAATRPEIAVISVGRNSYGHPAPETLERLEEAGALVRRTDREGTITIHGGDEHGGT